MNYTKNFTAKVFFSRLAGYILYYIVSAFIGKIAVIILQPFLQYLIKDYNRQIFTVAYYIVNLLIMYAVMVFLISRDGRADTGKHRYSVVKNSVTLLCAALLFFGILLFFYYFPQFSQYAYIISLYFSYEPVWSFIPHFAVFDIIPLFFVYTGLILAVSVLLSSIGYSFGRKKWIEAQKKKIQQIREKQSETKGDTDTRSKY